MNEVNKTLYIPLYGKAMVSKQNIILKDKMAEKIWDSQNFELKGKSKSKWLCYNMAMRARMFDDWTNIMLKKHPESMVLHIGCGLDGRVKRVKRPYKKWYDGDFADVIEIRKKYYSESDSYHMITLNAADSSQVQSLPESESVIVVLEGISMYLTNEQLRSFFLTLQNKYEHIYVFMDVYTVFGAKASKYKNPINEVGVTKVYGVDDINKLLSGLRIRFKKEYSMTPKRLVDELGKRDRFIFKLLFTGKMYRKIYRLYELEAQGKRIKLKLMDENVIQYVKNKITIKVKAYQDNARREIEQMDIVYKKLTENELSTIIKMRIDQLTEEYTSAGKTVPEGVDLEKDLLNFYKKNMAAGTYVSWLAFDGDKIVGTSGMSFAQKPPYFTCPSGKLGILSSMYTDPKYRRLGIATQLLDRVVKEAKEYGCGTIYITASDMGVKLYESYGFKHNGNFMQYNF